ncbi:MAG: hypothetical protein ABEJ26_10895 [Halosimplex sp.]
MSAVDEAATLYVPDETTSSDAIAEIVDTIARYHSQEELGGVVFASSEWL